jgi:hypothetical protein
MLVKVCDSCSTLVVFFRRKFFGVCLINVGSWLALYFTLAEVCM